MNSNPEPASDGVRDVIPADVLRDVQREERGQYAQEFDDRPWCITHTLREPCGVCASYIAAGL